MISCNYLRLDMLQLTKGQQQLRPMLSVIKLLWMLICLQLTLNPNNIFVKSDQLSSTPSPSSSSSSSSDSSSSYSADLCYLKDGGSSQTFTVNEATPINSVIGTLQVIGNVSTSSEAESEIELSLAPHHSANRLESGDIPIRIEPRTKDLILIRKLDKESSEGESGIVIGVKCRKRSQSTDPSIIIPVRIIVTDANDHAPEFIGTPYIVNISEVTVPGSSLFPGHRIRANDGDSQGPFSTVEYSIETGPFSHLVAFRGRLGGDLVLTGPLDYETLPKFWVTIRAQDQGEPPLSATTTLTVIVNDADDQNPRFLDDKYSLVLPDNVREGQPLGIKPKPIRAVDPDTEINSPIEYSFNSDSREYSYFLIDPKYATIKVKRPLPPTVTLPLTLVIRATQTDNRDRYALTTVTILSRRESILPEIRFTKSNYSVSVLENVPLGSVLLTIGISGRPATTEVIESTNRPASSSSSSSSTSTSTSSSSGLTYQLLDDEGNHFGIRSNGEIIVKKPLDYELRPWYSFRVMASDGKQSDVTRVNISLINVNDHDPQFSLSHYTFFVNSESGLRSRSIIGEVKATDKDTGDTLDFTVKGPFARSFTIDRNGKISITSLKGLNTSQAHLIVMASDSGSPPRSSSVPVTVQFSPNLLKTGLARAIGDPSESTDPDLLGDVEDIDGRARSSGVNMSSLFNTTGHSAIVLVIVLGVLLATLFIIIITLTVHLVRHRKLNDVHSSSGLSSTSTDSCASSTDSGHLHPPPPPTSLSSHHLHHHHHVSSLHHPSSGIYGKIDAPSPRGGFSISSLAKKSSKVSPSDTIINDSTNLFGPTSTLPTGGLLSTNGVENPIFNLSNGGGNNNTNTLPNNLTSRYYGDNRSIGHGPSSGSGKSDPDSAIVSDASSSNDAPHNGSNSSSASTSSTSSNSSTHRQQKETSDSIVDLTSPESHLHHHNHHQLSHQQQQQHHHHHNNNDNRSLSPPPPPSITCTTTGTTGGGTASRISLIKWPQGSIPRRVKKLTWEDERFGYNTIINYANINKSTSNNHRTHGVSNNSSFDSTSANDFEESNKNVYHSFAATNNNNNNNNNTFGRRNNSSNDSNGLRSSDDFRRTELDPDVSVTPFRRSTFLGQTHHHGLSSNNEPKANLPDLTVYF
ncbi:protocadherin-16-like [Panonychus citri]|uniref:protocadherin-16-like n=1 Tax=Panonychus citri TaxID=50023 RepID=UPI002307D896|nr:protocadherin-16-like [Panonychus citri]